eukprot:CAMPEP_0185018568 /NCGR_PEP_ID=MMETSP1103-20130426/1243_1 /TAXON_ID=36769 /ORGANISM="Paraphysomonas bandaiensis, Strain Caron Lab Isolate" /LENGTH=720 /DNA_ID=CAMNT_0027548413 /DNA_START=90 /DNA_END=2252 /DNA_ORIENTATION=-
MSGNVQKSLFDKILIANRGEIACRVMRTAKRMGIKTVAIYSEADARSMHVRMADEAYCVGGPKSQDSYLQMNRILDVALKSGAQAIHPGYGFLSENAKFVDMVESKGIKFIGPSSFPMNAMGDKINSKKIAKDANCFVIPGFEGEVENETRAVQLAKEIGYPVMIKASAGGGGKGMRVAYNDAEVHEAFSLCKNEAMSSFGDDRMLIERFIEDPHHIEIQVIADAHGNVAAFPERECSVQRRNQKVVEEAPSCLIDPETRKNMQNQAIALCKAVGYRSAGTIEMLCDNNKNFYFLEMNTRLQVEHPITEMISGEDLVELMIRVAAGEKLPQRFLDSPHVPFNGWAIESRVYAEDPLRNFLPSIGPLNTYVEPPALDHEGNVVRIDTGVFEGGVISMYYDPMIAKLCTRANDRPTAIALMDAALSRYVVDGLGNNMCFLQSIMRNESFRNGTYGTKFIGLEYPTGFHGVDLNPEETTELVATAAAMHHATLLVRSGNDMVEEIKEQTFVAVLGGQEGVPYRVTIGQEEGGYMDIDVTPMKEGAAGGGSLTVMGLDYSPGARFARVFLDKEIPDGPVTVSNEYLANGSEFGMETDPDSELKDTAVEVLQIEAKTVEGYRLRYKGSQQEVLIRTELEHEMSAHMRPPEKKDFSNMLRCPMPGTLVSVDVEPGQHVVEGQELAVVEAMKMQNILRATKNAVIKSVSCKAGANLKTDQVILEYES